ncbi:MAG: amidohydrolase family protein [Patescibacteria group bacterium]|nr:amidohydrolase family protein [Patescibacteria group bacterium]
MSLLIKNVQIVDGRGRKPYKGDVLVQKDRISAIGNLRSKQVKDFIDGLGNYLIPGFVDPAATTDRYLDLLLNPGQSRLKEQGIGTVIGGNGGASLAPLIYGQLDALSKWADGINVNIDWHTAADFFKSLSRLDLGINFGTFIGYDTVLQAITGGEERGLTKNEIKIVHRIIENGLKDGAFGVSLRSGSYKIMAKSEIKGMLDLVTKYHCSVSLSIDVRSGKEEIEKAIEAFSRKNRVKILVADFWPIAGHEGVFEEVLSSAPSNVKFVLKPYPGVIYQALDVLPEWITKDRDRDNLAKALLDEDVLKKLEPELAWIAPEKCLVVYAGRHEVLSGKTLKELSEIYDLPPVKTLLKVFSLCKLRVSLLYPSANETILMKHIKDENVFISSYSNSSFMETAYLKEIEQDGFTRFLKTACESDSKNLPGAVKQVTSAPARFLNLKNRGVIKEGYAADLTLIDKDNFKTIASIAGGITKGIPLRHRG